MRVTRQSLLLGPARAKKHEESRLRAVLGREEQEESLWKSFLAGLFLAAILMELATLVVAYFPGTLPGERATGHSHVESPVSFFMTTFLLYC